MSHQHPAAPDVDDAVEAEHELRAALDDYGATSMRLCAKGDVSPSALRAIAASIRSLGRT